jgi:sigma-B regulation protein RsbU (phosphoserine phosphatase)
MFKRRSDLPFAAITGATALVVVSGLVALLSSLQIERLFHSSANEVLPALHAARELEIALLEQRGFVSSYMIDGGNREWREELQRREGAFPDWLRKAQNSARAPGQVETLNQLERVYRAYDETRDEVFELYDQGYSDEAYMLFLYDLNDLYYDAHLLCEDLVDASRRYVDGETARAQRRIQWIRWLILVSLGVTIGLGGSSVWGLARGLRAEQARRAHEAHMLAARRIQERLLPDTAPETPGFDIHSVWHPAEFAAGDYFDYLHFSDGSLGMVVGDVTGHGIGPALLMASTRAYLRSVAQTHVDLGDILTLANSVLARDIEEGRFVTLLLGRIDLQSKSLTYVNAGHPSGYVLDESGNVKASLKSTGLPLGVSADFRFTPGEPIPLTPGDIIVLFSDGVVEATSPEGGSFGVQRALDVFRANRTKPAREIAESLYQVVSKYARPGTLTDDFTATVVKVEGSAITGHG